MSSRERLLAKLRAQEVPPAELPALAGPWTRYADRLAQFRAAVSAASGQVVEAPSGRLAQVISELAAVHEASARRYSLISGIFEPAAQEPPNEPQAFADLELVVAPASFGVAENGAVWIDAELVPIRAALFLPEHLVLVLPRDALVDTLHDAYERLGGRAGRRGYGCFVSGPSKTADIEQQLIIGAHGPRSLTLVLH